MFRLRHLLARSKEREREAIDAWMQAEALIARQEEMIARLKRGVDFQRARACVAEHRAANPARELARIGAEKRRAPILARRDQLSRENAARNAGAGR